MMRDHQILLPLIFLLCTIPATGTAPSHTPSPPTPVPPTPAPKSASTSAPTAFPLCGDKSNSTGPNATKSPTANTEDCSEPTHCGRCPYDCGDDDSELADWIKDGGIIIFIYGAFTSFYVLAVVVEDYFVPALNIMCDVANIPSDVAGATFMAAGASSPEMFANIISLFITHSALGVGTIVGSEIFNHLCICAGAVAYSKSGELKLDPRILGREVIFYALACITLVMVMMEFNDSEGRDCERWTYLRWYHGVFLFIGYVLYALTCSFYQSHVIPCLCPYKDVDELEQALIDGEGNLPVPPAAVPTDDAIGAINKIGSITSDPRGLERHLSRGKSDVPPVSASFAMRFGDTMTPAANAEPQENFHTGDGDDQGLPLERKKSASGASVMTGVLSTIIPALAGPDKDRDKEIWNPEHIECYIWKKSRFYNAFRFTSKTWQMRWMVIDKDGFRYFKNADKDSGGRAFNIFQDSDDDVVTISSTNTQRQRNIFQLCCPKDDKQTMVALQAQDPEHTRRIMQCINLHIMRYRQKEGETVEQNNARREKAWDMAQRMGLTTDAQAEEADDQGHEHESLIAMPKTVMGKVFHILLFPWKAKLHYSLCDVRHEEKRGCWAYTAIMSVVWLAAWSYAMTECLEKIGSMLGLSELVMGLTVSAAGTSFPNVFASMLVARQGLGNMAISNAFGSNVFNIFTGLGIPWFLICVAGNSDMGVDDMVYHNMQQGGVGFPVLILLGLLLGFMILLLCTGWRIYMSHGYVFVLLYIGYLVWAFAFKAKGPEIHLAGARL